MLTQHAPWVAQAWQHWHRPWAVTHASWLDGADGAHELALRLHYPAWCDRYALQPTLLDFADTVGWRLLGLPPASFERVATRVGLTLMFAADRRLRLLRGAVVGVDQARWALERAHFVPESVAAAIHGAVSTGAAEEHAALSLRWCLDAEPSLWARMRLRFAREQVPSEEAFHEPGRIDALVQTHLGRLWRTALRIAHDDKAAP